MFARFLTRSPTVPAILIALAVASSANASPISHASPLSHASDVPTRVVRYDDLNLTTDAGANMFRRRAHQAVADMYDGFQPGSPIDRATVARAERTALARADAQVAATIDRARAGAAHADTSVS